MRLDKYLKVSRLIKRRTIANEACDKGHVSLNGKVAKASTRVAAGDILTIALGDKVSRYEILTVDHVQKAGVSDLFRALPPLNGEKPAAGEKK